MRLSLNVAVSVCHETENHPALFLSSPCLSLTFSFSLLFPSGDFMIAPTRDGDIGDDREPNKFPIDSFSVLEPILSH